MSLGTVLVIGGCGCVGFHIVKALQKDGLCSSIHVFSRNPNHNRLPGVEYHAGSLTSSSDIARVLSETKPVIVYHVASPVSSGNNVNEKVFHEINVKGTQLLLDLVKTTPSVKALIYTSSSSVAQEPYNLITEAAPLITRSSGSNYYSVTKALADVLVLKANDPSGVRTLCLRICVIYGERDNQMIPGILKNLKDKRQNVQIGNNTSRFDVLSANNAARAHILAAQALIAGIDNPSAPKVDGEAFFVTDGDPVLFWDFSRKIWHAAGDRTPPEAVKILPGWLILGLAISVEWAYWIFTLGQRTPMFLRSHTIRWVISTRTFSIEKAKQRLGYQPMDDRDSSIADGVNWCLRQEEEKKQSGEKIS